MLKQIRFLSRIQLCNLLGLNEIRHTKDKSRRMRYLGLALAWLVVGGMMCAYIVMLSFGLTEMGMGEIVPVYLSAVCSLAILIFTFFKAGSVIFPVHSYEILVSLPVSQTAIVISRFLTMYVSNLLLCLLIMIPGMAVYALKLHPSLGFYLYGIPGMILLPLLPLTLATAAGAGITAVTSRMKHKSLAASGPRKGDMGRKDSAEPDGGTAMLGDSRDSQFSGFASVSCRRLLDCGHSTGLYPLHIRPGDCRESGYADLRLGKRCTCGKAECVYHGNHADRHGQRSSPCAGSLFRRHGVPDGGIRCGDCCHSGCCRCDLRDDLSEGYLHNVNPSV